MNMLIKDTEQWAENLFANADLGDQRRTKRLVKLSEQMAANIGSSIVQSSDSQASVEGAYRFIRNDKIIASSIATAGFNALLSALKQASTILALEDTSTLTYKHSVKKELGHTGPRKDCAAKGMMAHSVLMVDADNENTIGLGEQYRWCRNSKSFGKSRQRAERDYCDKESYKWQRASESMATRFAPVMNNIISVCDRESDLFDYIKYKQENQQRFVVRANHDRKLFNESFKVSEFIAKQSTEVSYQVKIQQKGGRKSRVANVDVRYAQVEVGGPKQRGKTEKEQLTIISCDEVLPPEGTKPLCWKLYTNESIKTAEQALKIVRYYELRWRVEEFHKAWKSAGTQVESLRLQSRSNLEKMIVITAFIAVRLLQLRELVSTKNAAEDINCQEFFSPLEWKLLWTKTEKKVLPKELPSLNWAYYALAKLGRWHDSKRNGVVGWNALWDGWQILTQLVDGARLVHQQLSLDEM